MSGKPVFFYCQGTKYIVNFLNIGFAISTKPLVVHVGNFEIGGRSKGEFGAVVPGLDGRTTLWTGDPTTDPFPALMDHDKWDVRQVVYPAAIGSINAGITAVHDAIMALPAGTPFALGGYSQGAAVMSGILIELTSGSLTSRYGDFLGGTMFGNPRRKVNWRGPVGGTWSGAWDVPGSTTGGHGSFPADGEHGRLVTCPDTWADFAALNDVVTATGDSVMGQNFCTVNGLITNLGQEPLELYGQFLGQYVVSYLQGKGFAENQITPLVDAMNASMAVQAEMNHFTDGAGWEFDIGGGGHTQYPLGIPVGDPDNGLSHYQIALKYLDSLAEEYMRSPTILPPTSSGWATRLYPPSTEWWDTPTASAVANYDQGVGQGSLSIFEGSLPDQLDQLAYVAGGIIGFDLTNWREAITNFMAVWSGVMGDSNIFDANGDGFVSAVQGLINFAHLVTFDVLIDFLVAENFLTTGSEINAANVTGVLADLAATWDAVYQAVHGGSDTGWTIADVKTSVSSVNTTANTGVTNAATAQTTANTGVTNAATAQGTANTAVTNASTAQSTANTAVTNASTAQSTADTANSTATTANTGKQTTWDYLYQVYYGGSGTGYTASQMKTSMSAVLTQANTGVTNASTAQGTANTAGTNVQDTWDKLYQVYYGGSGTGYSSTQMKTSMSAVLTQANTGVTNASAAQSTANTASSNTTSIANNTYNGWYGSGGTGSMLHLSTVIGAVSSTFLNGYTIHWLSTPGTSTWYRTSTGLSGGTSFTTSQILDFWVICIGSGGGGGAGLGSSAGGGTGGQPGKYFAIEIEPDLVPASLSYTVAAGAAGRAAGSGDATPTAGSDSSFGSLASSGWALTTAIASPFGYFTADDSRPGAGGTGGAAGPTGTAGGATPLAAGGAAGAANGNGGSNGVAVNYTNERRGCGSGGGGGAAGHPSGYGGTGGTGGAGGGGGGGGGGSALANSYGGKGGTGGNGVILVMYRLKQ